MTEETKKIVDKIAERLEEGERKAQASSTKPTEDKKETKATTTPITSIKPAESKSADSKTATTTAATTTIKKYVTAYDIPGLPKDYEKDLQKYLDESKKNPYRDKRFEKILRKTQEELKAYLTNYLSSNKYEPQSGEGWLYAQGTFPVLLCAHMDTVHKEIPKDLVYKDNILTSPQGVGGDDRCGVYTILKLIDKIKCSVLFLEDEESGCVGARKFILTKLSESLVEKFKYIIEIDRKGTNDCVFYDLDSKEFEDFIEKPGHFKTAWGTCSDISYLAPALKTAAVNLSSCYFQEHHKEEYIDMKAFAELPEKVMDILAQGCEHFDYKESLKSYKYNDWWHGYGYTGYSKNKYDSYDYDEYDDFDDYGYEGYSGYNYTGYTATTKKEEDFRIPVSKYTEQKLRGLHTEYKQKVFHVWFYNEDATSVVEISAVSSDEAVGILVQKYRTVTADDIIEIFEA